MNGWPRPSRSADVDVFAAIATGGATNTGVVDDLDGVATVCHERGVWMHVDAAYGGAAMVAPSARPLFHGIERADSFVVDPHKWLFSPFDCAALVYRDPNLARAALTQQAGYLEVLTPTSPWNPSDLAIHMTRRVRGLPLWFSLAANGTKAYERAVERGLTLAREAAHRIAEAPHLDLVMEPELSVVLFRRRGWGPRRLPALVRRGTRVGPRPAGADRARGRDDVPLLLRQPAHHDRRHRARARRDALTTLSQVRPWLSAVVGLGGMGSEPPHGSM